MTDPPPIFLVPCTNLSERGLSTLFHAHFLPSEPRQLTLVSSDHTTLFQSSRVHALWLIAKSILSFLWCLLSMGLLFFTTAFQPAFFSFRRTVSAERLLLVMFWSSLVTCVELSAFPELMRQQAWQISVSESLVGWLPWGLGASEQCLDQSRVIVEVRWPVAAEI